MKKIIDIIEKSGISVFEYKEENKLCGYELNTYTEGGVNEIIFLDFRQENQDPKNPTDFIKEFESYMQCKTIDERIELNRQNEDYKKSFSLKESVIDFEKWEKMILALIKQLKKNKVTLTATFMDVVYSSGKGGRKQISKTPTEVTVVFKGKSKHNCYKKALKNFRTGVEWDHKYN